MDADIVLPRLVQAHDFSFIPLREKVRIHIPDPYHYTDDNYSIYWNTDLEYIIIDDALMNYYRLDCSGTNFTLQTVTPFLIMRIFNIYQVSIDSSHCENPNDNIHNLLDTPISTMRKCSLVLRSHMPDFDSEPVPIIESYDPTFDS